MYKKILISFLLIALATLSSTKVVDRVSSDQLDKAFTRSVTVFAIARGLNGLISVVQGTEVYATPAGVGVNFAVGEIVDPMNDMVERFSWVMLMSSVSLGVQEIMLHLGQSKLIQALLAFSALVMLAMLWFPKLWHATSFNLVFKTVCIFVFLRFTIPLLLLLNEGIYNYMLEPKYEESKAALIFSNDEIKGLVDEVQANQQKQVHVQKFQEDSLMQKAQNYFNETIQTLNVKRQLQILRVKFKKLLKNLEDKFNYAIDYIVVLITIFLVQNLLLPLSALWLFYKLFHRFIKTDLSLLLYKQPDSTS